MTTTRFIYMGDRHEFCYLGEAYVKIPTITDEDGDDWNAIRLYDNTLCFFYNEDWVEEYPFVEKGLK